MALLMVKTHDLSWQDRTINIEVMLAPSRNQLLFNKHKTLETKCNAEKRVYDKEKQTVLKDFVTGKRLLERKQQALFRRRSEILFQRVASGTDVLSYSKSHTLSNSSGKKRLTSAPPQLEGDSANVSSISTKSGFFLTETKDLAPTKTDNLSVSDVQSASRSRIINSDGRAGDVTPHISAFSSISRNESVSPFSSKRVKSVRFVQSDFRDQNLNQAQIGTPRSPLKSRVDLFCKAQSEFNTKPPITYRKLESVHKGTYKQPLVAKRYSGLKTDIGVLEDAFNNMCINGSTKDDFKTLVKLASKIKANTRLARNQSVVPTIATIRCIKSFKQVVDRNKNCSPRQAEAY